jgi:hypothetical protein
VDRVVKDVSDVMHAQALLVETRRRLADLVNLRRLDGLTLAEDAEYGRLVVRETQLLAT